MSLFVHMIEPMLLIPFVENAFKHGVGMVIDPIIDIDLHVKGDALTFTVKNKIAPESVQDKDSSSGIGLKNVQRRLELLYPDTHKMTITQDSEWFEVKLYLSQK
jgi:two-component system, LytTR family, sensor kinase